MSSNLNVFIWAFVKYACHIAKDYELIVYCEECYLSSYTSFLSYFGVLVNIYSIVFIWTIYLINDLLKKTLSV